MVLDQQKQATIAKVVADYLAKTKPVMLLVHVLYIAVISTIFSAAYVISFHFTSLVSIYEEAHSIQSFGMNLKVSVENDNAIYANLNRILSQSGGIRAYVYRYHNGLAAINGVPFFFQTMTHEVIAPGTTRIMTFEQRIPASIHIAINNAFINNACAIIRDSDRDRENQDYYFWLSRGAKHLIRCPIYMANGDLFGFVGVDFTSSMIDEPTAEKNIKQSADEIAKLFATKKL